MRLQCEQDWVIESSLFCIIVAIVVSNVIAGCITGCIADESWAVLRKAAVEVLIVVAVYMLVVVGALVHLYWCAFPVGVYVEARFIYRSVKYGRIIARRFNFRRLRFEYVVKVIDGDKYLAIGNGELRTISEAEYVVMAVMAA